MNQKQIRAAVEAMLFACGEPIGSDTRFRSGSRLLSQKMMIP